MDNKTETGVGLRQPRMSLVRAGLRMFMEQVERPLDWVFGPENNPMHHLGALGYFFFWIVIVSGIYLFIFFDTGMTQAYESVEYMTHAQWYAAGVMRSFHRYASDAMIAIAVLHILRELAYDKYRGAKWFSWFTGVPALFLIYICGITGYWLVWDQFAQFIAIATTEWLDALGIFGQSIARNFLNSSILGDRFFTLMVFIHVIVPLFLLFAMWIHLQRISKAKVNPPRLLGIGSVVSMLIASFAFPALSQGPANLDVVPSVLNMDWFYFPIYPLLDYFSGELVWAMVGGTTLLIIVVPWMPPKKKSPVAVVNLDHCNGCNRCVDDCPFSAITLVPRTDDLAFEHEAFVDTSLCTSCGICVGSCPSSTPFRRMSEPVTGIELPDINLAAMIEAIDDSTQQLSGNARILTIGCAAGPAIDRLTSEDTGSLQLPCVGMLPPSFIDYVLARNLVDGVLLTGCREDSCQQRFGIEWTVQRINGERDPYLRKRVPRDRIKMAWAGKSGLSKVRKEMAAFRSEIRAAGVEQEESGS